MHKLIRVICLLYQHGYQFASLSHLVSILKLYMHGGVTSAWFWSNQTKNALLLQLHMISISVNITQVWSHACVNAMSGNLFILIKNTCQETTYSNQIATTSSFNVVCKAFIIKHLARKLLSYVRVSIRLQDPSIVKIYESYFARDIYIAVV